MLKTPFNLKKARILVTNDDGIHAPGLKVLEKIAKSLSSDVWVVAPESEHSGASHSLTLRRPLQISKVATRKFAVSGTPSDCTLIAVNHLMKDRRPDIVLSGVNRGANLGEDVLYSGTVAAAMEGAMLGIPAIAFSQVRVRAKDKLHWETAAAFGPEVVRKLVTIAWPKGVLMSVNFPPVPPKEVTGIEVGRQGRRMSHVEVVHARDPFEREVTWIGDFPTDEPEHPETDLGIIMTKAVSVTPLHFDLTHAAMLRRMEGLFPQPKTVAKRKTGKVDGLPR
ncbi:5'/3'-nucleotidase SurE [Dongia rigui]|uniref:5'-nucleotidase SurE n=1 Tax=Dongia rigui TaxID=940149 RepID=A0ABU5E188_9PROT|nr:5'/3'-nucleotidase SurE [Dongia rigui]MDY0873315.1 5'/3'-nucleotidase SurE [Dongia rigui]